MSESGNAEAVALGREIAAARTRRRWTQQQLADVAGVSQSSLKLWEVGRRAPSAVNVMRVARALGVRAGDLMDAAQDAVEKNAGPDA